jgi:hypothetical protein
MLGHGLPMWDLVSLNPEQLDSQTTQGKAIFADAPLVGLANPDLV